MGRGAKTRSKLKLPFTWRRSGFWWQGIRGASLRPLTILEVWEKLMRRRHGPICSLSPPCTRLVTRLQTRCRVLTAECTRMAARRYARRPQGVPAFDMYFEHLALYDPSQKRTSGTAIFATHDCGSARAGQPARQPAKTPGKVFVERVCAP